VPENVPVLTPWTGAEHQAPEKSEAGATNHAMRESPRGLDRPSKPCDDR